MVIDAKSDCACTLNQWRWLSIIVVSKGSNRNKLLWHRSASVATIRVTKVSNSQVLKMRRRSRSRMYGNFRHVLRYAYIGITLQAYCFSCRWPNTKLPWHRPFCEVTNSYLWIAFNKPAKVLIFLVEQCPISKDSRSLNIVHAQKHMTTQSKYMRLHAQNDLFFFNVI